MVSRNAVSTEPKGMRTHENFLPNVNKIDLENDKSTKSTTFNAMQRETTVYEFYVELKEDVFTKQGFFDLAKVPSLYISGAGQFLRNLRLENCLRQKDIAEIIGVTYVNVKNWEHNKNRIPLQSLVKIAETLGVSRDTIYSLIDQGTFITKNNIPVKVERIHKFIEYLNPIKDRGIARITLFECCPVETLLEIKNTFNVKPKSYGGNYKIIACRELHNFLKTFFRYSKVPKIHPPLTNEVKGWYDDSIDLKRSIIIPCLQSDGYHQPCKQGYSEVGLVGNSKILHHYFVDAIYYEYSILPSSYYCNFGESYITYYKNKSIKRISDDVVNLAKSTKTSPAHGQSIEGYSKEPQPHLNYLINASETEQQIALRIWASTEGEISINRKDGYIYPRLRIGCAHPDLVKQLQQIARRLNIKFSIPKERRNWSGIKGLYNSTLSSCLEFLKFGGFIKGVKISSNSKYHEGIDKDVLFLGILEYKKRELENNHLKKLPIQQVHHEINRIVENRKYKSVDYYINYFS